jgi:hypothetical protein
MTSPIQILHKNLSVEIEILAFKMIFYLPTAALSYSSSYDLILIFTSLMNI